MINIATGLQGLQKLIAVHAMQAAWLQHQLSWRVVLIPSIHRGCLWTLETQWHAGD
jgi:hypothetical protein